MGAKSKTQRQRTCRGAGPCFPSHLFIYLFSAQSHSCDRKTLLAFVTRTTLKVNPPISERRSFRGVGSDKSSWRFARSRVLHLEGSHNLTLQGVKTRNSRISPFRRSTSSVYRGLFDLSLPMGTYFAHSLCALLLHTKYISSPERPSVNVKPDVINSRKDEAS